MPRRRTLLPVSALLLAGCGYVGDPLPPTLDIPRRVPDLRVQQLAGKAVIEFTIPELTTEGLALRLERVDLRAGPYARDPFDADAWAAGAKQIDAAGLKPGPARLEVDAAPWMGQEVFWRVRLFSHKGRAGDWSDFVALTVIQPPEPPAVLTAEIVAEGVRLTWPGDTTLRILRRTAKGEPVEVATASGQAWVDTNVRPGETYQYTAQAVVRSGGSVAASGLSASLAITFVDRFPPAVPRGLAALAASSSIELSWDENTEADLGGYIVYRAVEDGAPQRLGDVRQLPGLSDRDVQPSIRYRYAVASVDRSGNESRPSPPVEIVMP